MIYFEVPAIEENEFAVVVIGGPSKGESVLLHYGDGRWLVVDSCTYKGENLPLAFLDKVEADKNLVEHIICSHWHDDHVMGMSDLLKTCPNSYFRVPLVSNAEILPQYFVYKSEKSVKEDEKKAWKMFQKCLDVLDEREIGADLELKCQQFVKIGDQIVDYNTHNTRVDIKAFSPSQEMYTRFGQMLVNGDADNCEFDDSEIDPNMCSITLGIKFGSSNRHLFLGADLKCNRNETAPVNSCRGECAMRHDMGMCNLKGNRFFEKLRNISYTKLNHHSSQTGYCCEYWDNYVTEDNIGVSTVFTMKKLPRKDMARLYLKKSAEYYVTSRRSQKKLKRHQIKLVLGDNKYINSLEEINTTPGIVVTRYDLETGDYKGTEVYLNAFKVKREDVKLF